MPSHMASALEAWNTAPVIGGVHVIFNLLAFAVVAFVTWILVIGIKESARFNNVMVALKLVILAFFIVVGATYVKPANWSPFMPNGFTGVWIGASLIFFAFIGFDAVSTAAEECRNPGRDVPIGIIASLGICTVIYVATAAVLTGIEPWQKLGVANPLASAFSSIGLDWAAGVVSLGAVISMTAVLLVFQLGQPRIFFAMSRDGLLPKYFARVHPKYRTPHVTTIWSGVAVGSIAAVTNINEMVELTNIGTLFAFVLVCAGVVILRRTDPDRAAVVPNAARAADTASRDGDVHLPDARPSVGDMAPLRSLARRGARRLLRVRLPEQPSEETQRRSRVKKRFLSVCSMLVVCATLCLAAAPVASQELVREKLKSDVGIELLGRCLLYSFNYQYTPVKQLGLEVGLGALGGGSIDDDNTMLIFVPFGGKFYIIPKDGSLYLAAGGVFLNASTDSGPFDESGSTSYGYLGLGFEYRSEGGLLFRGSAYGLIAGGSFFIWPGLRSVTPSRDPRRGTQTNRREDRSRLSARRTSINPGKRPL